MFSNKTYLELVRVIETLNHSEIDRIIALFRFQSFSPAEKVNKIEKTTSIFFELKQSNLKGPFENEPVQMELLQYLIDQFFINSGRDSAVEYIEHDVYGGEGITNRNAFSKKYPRLANSLKRDGYVITEKTIKKLLPEEIEESKIESELMILLTEFEFEQSKSHLEQAVNNHTQGNWAGANGQFRTFIESLLIELANRLAPGINSKTAVQSMKILTSSVSPPFLSEEINEVNFKDKEASFIHGLWKRLHSEGSHPGLSNEDDSTFRYLLSIVFANYLLRRLKSRSKQS